MTFFGYTKPDGSRTHDAPANWPWGTIGPMTEYSARFVLPPDEVLYEKPEKAPKVKRTAAAVATHGLEEAEVAEEVNSNSSVFDYMANVLALMSK